MKTLFRFLPAILAASVPASLAAELTGLNVPSGLDGLSVFSALVVSLLALLAVGDYSRSYRFQTNLAVARTAKADHPLAA